MHCACEPAEECSICHEPFQKYERPITSEPWGTYDPRERQSMQSVGPLLTGLLAGLATLLLYYLMTLN